MAPGMTAPRQVLAGTTYLVTRRCLQRCFLLRPSRLTNETLGYLLAVAAARYSVQVHAFCVLSNHFHLVVTDTEARLPAFHQFLDSLIGRSVNAALGRTETFWAPNSYSAVALVTPADIVSKTAYVLANPVAAGLVRRACRWPGLWSNPASIGGSTLRFDRPRHFFRENGSMPESAELHLVAPKAFANADSFRGLVSAAFEELELAAREQAGASGRGFLGEARVLKVRPSARPRDRERGGGLSPRIACRDKWKRIEALGRLATFIEAYRASLRAWRSGIKGVVFPAGTYLARVTHGVACAAPG
jgi:REP element-mobilizing transposase RayT